jgi:hypothetical protein
MHAPRQTNNTWWRDKASNVYRAASLTKSQQKSNTKTPRLDLGLGRLKRRDQHVAHLASRLVEVEAHPLAAQALGDNVEVDAAPKN